MSGMNGTGDKLNGPWSVTQLGPTGQPEEISVSYEQILNTGIRIVPGALFPVVRPFLQMFAAQDENPLAGWWWLSYVDEKTEQCVGAYATVAQSPYRALIHALLADALPANGFIDIKAYWSGYIDENMPIDMSLTDKLLTPDEARDFKWNNLATQSLQGPQNNG